MKRSKSSKAWLQEHVTDAYVHRAKTEGYRSRAAFKLLEIDERDHLFKKGMTVVDLGAAPGAWCQIALDKVGSGGAVFALDLLPVAPLPGLQFLHGDFCDDAVLAQFQQMLAGRCVDLVLSDMAPNLSGIAVTDQARSIYLAELALAFAVDHLSATGVFVAKVFQGQGFDAYRSALQQQFHSVAIRKPKASRDRSAEVYVVGRRLKK